MAARDKADAAAAEMVVIGLFPDPDVAAEAIRQLKDAGFTSEEIGVIMPKLGPDGKPLPELVVGEEVEAEGVKTGAATGGIIGGLVGLVGSLLIPGLGAVTLGGVLASTLLGAGVGVVTGGVVGLLIGMGASRADAEYFDQGVRAAGTLVTVQPEPARVAEARSILQSTGADMGPSGRPAGTAAAGARDMEENEPWRGSERRYRQDASFGGPERRNVHV
jgi:hypothetical protein